MARITVLLDTGSETYDEELKLVEGWRESHKDRISFISENQGCGCCVDIWDVECADDLVTLLPPSLLCTSDWSNPKEK